MPSLVAIETDRPPAPNTTLEAVVDRDSLHPWHSEAPDGVLVGSALIDDCPVCVWAQDPSFLGGSLGAVGGARIAHLIGHASRSGVPVIGFPGPGGARLQEGIASLNAYGEIFRQQALSRVPQITITAGVCAGGAAYSSALGDFVVVLAPHGRLFLTGPRITQQTIGEEVTAEELGGPRVQAANGVAHLVASDPDNAALLTRNLLGYFTAGTPRSHDRIEVSSLSDDPSRHLPSSVRKVYDVRSVIESILDRGEHLELAATWARNIVTTLGCLGGRSVGVIANQPRYRAGAIDSAASEKGSWFVELCDRLNMPLIVLVDTPGFLPGINQERAGVIRHGAGLLRAFGRATTTKITLTLRQAYGGAHIVMNSHGLGADLTLAWPDVHIGVMGAHQAVTILERRALIAGADPESLARQYSSSNLGVEGAVHNGFVDEIVLPIRTRERLARALEEHA